MSESDSNFINEYFNLSPNLIELFDESVYKMILNDIHLSILWIKLIIIILEKNQNLRKNHFLIADYLLSSRKYQEILINLKNNKQIDSQFILIKLFNQIGIISNGLLSKLINGLNLNNHSLWNSFWTQCKYHCTKKQTNQNKKLKNYLLDNCYLFGIILICSNDSNIISIMYQNKSFWYLIKTIIEIKEQKNQNNIIFKHVLRYFNHQKFTLNCNKNNLQFLQFWFFVFYNNNKKEKHTFL